MIDAKIVADSINSDGNRLTSFVITYPRIILAEVNTHRLFSKSTASSRAIPVQRMLDMVRENPFVPIYWGKNQKGMQADEELTQDQQLQAKRVWLNSAELAIEQAKQMMKIGVHKQIANRLLEPFMYVTTIISGTEWGNFFNLRCSKKAQPEFKTLSICMLKALISSKPILKKSGEWHLPFMDQYLDENLSIENQLKISSARCARVSYLNFEGDFKHEKDYELHDNLVLDGHMSPLEHQGTPCDRLYSYRASILGNFVGWRAYRKTIPNEHKLDFDPMGLLESVGETLQSQTSQ